MLEQEEATGSVRAGGLFPHPPELAPELHGPSLPSESLPGTYIMHVLRTTPEHRGYAKTCHNVSLDLGRLVGVRALVPRCGLIPPCLQQAGPLTFDVCRSITSSVPSLFVLREAEYLAYIPAIYFDKMPIAFRAYI